MTHDELLAEIDSRIGFVNRVFYKSNTGALEIRDLMISSLLALRAVVELHRAGNGDASRCEACYLGFDCPTIQAIEKELK